jgi:hypothetical protein
MNIFPYDPKNKKSMSESNQVSSGLADLLCRGNRVLGLWCNQLHHNEPRQGIITALPFILTMPQHIKALLSAFRPINQDTNNATQNHKYHPD